MNETPYVDLFTAKDRVVRQLRENGPQSYSRLLLTTLLPERVLRTALSLLEQEKKLRIEATQQSEDTVYQPVTGLFSGSFSFR
jgi:hypothetical protein